MNKVTYKWFNLILVIFLVFGLVGISFSQTGNGDEEEPTCESDCDPDTDCSDCEGCPAGIQCDDSCSSGTLKGAEHATTYYHQSSPEKISSIDFRSVLRYYSSPLTFIDKDYYCKTGSDEYDNCGDYCCTNYYDRCDSENKPCKPWEKCSDEDNTGCKDGSSGCYCYEEYCDGWCRENAPVFDGKDNTGCNYPSGTWPNPPNIPSKPPKYSFTVKTFDTDYGGNCYCGYYEIKNYYECDSSKINDSHPCSSNNCAPDFKNGRAYCCPSGECAHLGTFSVGDSRICYANGAEIQYEGHQLKCNNGVWEFTGNGETIYKFPFFYDEHRVYPEGYTYRDYSVVYPLNFEDKRIVRVYITDEYGSPDGNVEIKIFDSAGGVTSGNGDKVVSSILKTGEIRLYPKGASNGKDFNLYVDVYIPDDYKCFDDNFDPGYECLLGSYCVWDYNATSGKPSYCCPNGHCAYDGSCYEEGYHNLAIDGQTCKRRCSNNEWSGLGEGESCNDDCDCKYFGSEEVRGELLEYNLKCVETLKEGDKICCPEGGCGIEPGICCTPGEDCKIYVSGVKCNCVEGEWKCGNVEIEKKFGRILLTEKSNTYKLRFDVSGLSEVIQANVTFYFYFDNSTYSGDIVVTINCGEHSGVALDGVIEINFNDVNLENIPKYEVEIKARDITESEYLILSGVVMKIIIEEVQELGSV